jgi:hypothetical protein
MSSVNFAMHDFCSLVPNVQSVSRQFSSWATEEAERVRHERKPSERFPGACLRIISGLPTIRELRDQRPNAPLTGPVHFISSRVTSLVIFSCPRITVTITFSPSE